MRILVVSNRKPHRQGTGDAKVAFAILSSLSADGHDVVLKYPRSEPRWRSLVSGGAFLASGRPVQLGLTRSRKFRQDLEGLCDSNKFDAIVAVHARAAAHVPANHLSRTIAFIIDSYGQGYSTYRGQVRGVRGLGYRVEGLLMRRYELTLLRKSARVAVLSKRDCEYLNGMSRLNRRAVRIPYAVDVDYYGAWAPAPAIDPPRFGFIGRLNYLPNSDAVTHLVLNIWPALKRRWPDAQLRVAGASPPSKLRKLLADSGVDLAANVSDMRMEMQGLGALLVPMRIGGGVQTKVLEAMAGGIPVICTRFATNGIEARPGEHLLIAEDPFAYVQQAERVLSDDTFRRNLRAAAREWLLATHSPGRFEVAMTSLCREVAGESQQS